MTPTMHSTAGSINTHQDEGFMGRSFLPVIESESHEEGWNRIFASTYIHLKSQCIINEGNEKSDYKNNMEP